MRIRRKTKKLLLRVLILCLLLFAVKKIIPAPVKTEQPSIEEKVVPVTTTATADKNDSVEKVVEAAVDSIETTEEVVETIEEAVVEEEIIDEVPLLNQKDYEDVSYGKFGTIATDGCGIVVISMAASYMLDEMVDPIELARRYGNYNTENGSCWTLFENSAVALGLGSVVQTTSWSKVKKALDNGQLVACSQAPGLFTRTGHFILLTGMKEGRVMVNDPNGDNYSKENLVESFANGFSVDSIRNTAKVYFIYEAKAALQDTELVMAAAN